MQLKHFLKWRWTKANSKRYPLRLSRGLHDWGQLSAINFHKRWSFREGVCPSVFKCGVDIFPLNLLTFSPQTRYILQILSFIHLAQLISIFGRLRNQCKCKIADIKNTSLVFFFGKDFLCTFRECITQTLRIISFSKCPRQFGCSER